MDCSEEDTSLLGKRKRIPGSLDAKLRISPKTSISAVESTIQVKIIEQPPRVWYRDQKGRKTIFTISVGIVESSNVERLLRLDTPGAFFRTKLLYENGNEVSDSRILDLRTGSFPEPNSSSTTLSLRISDISKNHQNQKFRVRVEYACPQMPPVASAITDAIHVLSKHVKKSLPTELHIMKTQSPSSASSEDTMSTQATPPFDCPQIVDAPATPAVETSFKLANHTSLSRWCDTAHSILTHMEWTPYPSPSGKMEYKCNMCQAIQPNKQTAKHTNSCMLQYLLSAVERSPRLPSPAPLQTNFEMHERLNAATVFKPIPQSVFKTERRDDMGELSMISIGDLGVFDGKSSTFDDALMLKSLSQVSVNDDDYVSFSGAQVERLYHPPPPDSMHALSRFTETAIGAVKSEDAVAIVSVNKLPPTATQPLTQRGHCLDFINHL
ncbi:Nucleolar MIF4G domain-containing protein 1 [Aphanomyces cochlioides]|nr:Nucleolar MIF4G domain-containing protein 1 [Aphanomyces cochlioides]